RGRNNVCGDNHLLRSLYRLQNLRRKPRRLLLIDVKDLRIWPMAAQRPLKDTSHIAAYILCNYDRDHLVAGLCWDIIRFVRRRSSLNLAQWEYLSIVTHQRNRCIRYLLRKVHILRLADDM